MRGRRRRRSREDFQIKVKQISTSGGAHTPSKYGAKSGSTSVSTLPTWDYPHPVLNPSGETEIGPTRRGVSWTRTGEPRQCAQVLRLTSDSRVHIWTFRRGQRARGKKQLDICCQPAPATIRSGNEWQCSPRPHSAIKFACRQGVIVST